MVLEFCPTFKVKVNQFSDMPIIVVHMYLKLYDNECLPITLDSSQWFLNLGQTSPWLLTLAVTQDSRASDLGRKKTLYSTICSSHVQCSQPKI